MNSGEKREYVSSIFDLSGGKFKEKDIDFLFDFATGKLKNLFVKIIKSHPGSGSDGKYIMTTKTCLKFFKKGLKKYVDVSFDDNTRWEPQEIFLNKGRDIINAVKENINAKGFDKVRNIIDKLK